jgi:hypothetical protein
MEVLMPPKPYIPDYWSPEQAFAVYELLDELRDRVWDLYREQIQEQCRIDRDEDDDNQLDLFPFNDEIPF